MNLDTTVLIDLHREYRGKRDVGARDFFRCHAFTRFQVSVIALAEFMEGLHQKEEAHFLKALKIVPFEEVHALQAARLRRDLRKKGQLIGDFDILIAAAALQSGEPLVTANEDHFRRVEGLEVISYRKTN